MDDVVAFRLSLALMAAGGLYCWVRFFTNKESLLRQASTGITPFGFVDFALLFVCWLGVQAAAIAVLRQFYSVESIADFNAYQKSMAVFFASGGQLLVCIIAMALFFVRYGREKNGLGLQRRDLFKNVGIAFRWFCMVVPLLLIMQAALALLIPYEHSTLKSLQTDFNLLTLLSGWFGATVAAPICEEVVFRGVFQGWMQRFNRSKDPENAMRDIAGGWPVGDEDSAETESSVRFWIPILVSSIVFGAIHMGQGAAPIVLFFFGIALGYLYRKTGSVVPCIALHFFLNAFSMFWATLESWS